jgi:O-antigen ligase
LKKKMTDKMTSTSERNFESVAAVKRLPGRLDRDRLVQIADWLAVAVAVSLPWSTSATSILIVLWLVALIPTLDVASVRREVVTAAGGLPLVLFGLAAIGMLWADAAWDERLKGLFAFSRLLCIPLLFAQFRRSPRANWVIIGLLASLAAMLIVSFGLTFIPGLPWRGRVTVGVPAKDYITQSGFFAICIFGLLAQAVELWRAGRAALALVGVLLAALFLANIAYLATGRTALVVMLALLVPFLWWYFGWKGVAAAGLAAAVVACVLWLSSSYLRERVTNVLKEVQAYQETDSPTSAGLRLEYWRKAKSFVADAPLIGHGTGTIRELFRQAASGGQGATSAVTVNPHNQIIAVAIQLGVIGVMVLIAMWIAHLALFRGFTLISWFGFVIVFQNIVSSQFNSHLFDFTQGWLYVFGVGVVGGMTLRRPATNAEHDK